MERDEDHNVVMLSELFVAVPMTTIRRILRENNGAVEPTAAVLIEMNEEALKNQQADADSKGDKLSSSPSTATLSEAEILAREREAALRKIQERQKEVDRLIQERRAISASLSSSGSSASSSARKGVGSFQTSQSTGPVAQQREAEELVKSQTHSPSGKLASTEEEPLKRRASFPQPAPTPEPADPLARSLVEAQSPLKYLSSSKAFSSLLPQGNVLEALQQQLAAAYEKLFADMGARVEEQEQTIEQLREVVSSKDEEIASLKAALAEKSKQLSDTVTALDNLTKYQGAVKSVTEQVKVNLESGIAIAAAAAQGDISKFAATVKKEIAVAFLKEFNQKKEEGEQ